MTAPVADGNGPYAPLHARWRISLAVGESQTISPAGGPSSIGLEPGSGGSLSAFAKVSESSLAQPVETGTASYSANTTLALHAPVYALTFTAQGAAGAVSVSW